MSWLLDTCAISEYAKRAPNRNVIAWLDAQDELSMFISVITLGEIEKGILKLRATDAHRSQRLTAWLGLVEQRFAGRILPLDSASLHIWAQLSANAELAGKPLPVMAAVSSNTRPKPMNNFLPTARLANRRAAGSNIGDNSRFFL